MLKKLTVENFKGFGEPTVIPFAPITLLYGPNSSGKSAILQVLYLLKQTIERAPTDVPLLLRCGPGGLVDLGDFRSVVHDHDEALRIGIKIHLERKHVIGVVNASLLDLGEITLDYLFASRKGRIGIDRFAIEEKKFKGPRYAYTYSAVAGDRECVSRPIALLIDKTYVACLQ